MPNLKQVDFIKTDITEKVHVNKYQKLNPNQIASFDRIKLTPENTDIGSRMKANFGDYAIVEFENGNEYRIHNDGRVYNLKTGRKEAKSDIGNKVLSPEQEKTVAIVMALPENAHQGYKVTEIVSSGNFGYAVIKTDEGEEWMVGNDGKYSRITMDFDDDWNQKRYAYEAKSDLENVEIQHFDAKDADVANAWCNEQWKQKLTVYRRIDDIDGGFEFIAVPTEISAEDLIEYFGADFELCNELLNEVSPSFYDEARIPIDVDNGKDEAMLDFVQELSEESYGGNALKTLARSTITRMAVEAFPDWDAGDISKYLDRAIEDFAESNPGFFDEEVVTATSFGRVNVEMGAMDRRESEEPRYLSQPWEKAKNNNRDKCTGCQKSPEEKEIRTFYIDGYGIAYCKDCFDKKTKGALPMSAMPRKPRIEAKTFATLAEVAQNAEDFADKLKYVSDHNAVTWIDVEGYRFAISKTLYVQKLENDIPGKTVLEDEYYNDDGIERLIMKAIKRIYPQDKMNEAGATESKKYQRENKWKAIYNGIGRAYKKFGSGTTMQNIADEVVSKAIFPDTLKFFETDELCQEVYKQWMADNKK